MVKATPWPPYPLERPGTRCIGGWVGPRAGLDRCGKSRPHRDSIPGPSSPLRVEKRFGELANKKCGCLPKTYSINDIIISICYATSGHFPPEAAHRSLPALQTSKHPLQSHCDSGSNCSLPRTRHVTSRHVTN